MSFIDNISAIYFSASWQEEKVINFVNRMGFQCDPKNLWNQGSFRVNIRTRDRPVQHVCIGDDVCFDILT